MEVFLEMLKSEEIEKVSVDAEQADALLHLLDSVVIKLEGGTEEDLQILDIKPINIMLTKEVFKEKEDNKAKSITEKKADRYICICYICIYMYTFVCIHKYKHNVIIKLNK